MKKSIWLSTAVLAIGLLAGSAANAQIKLGLGAPITGPNATFGAQLKNGMQKAVETINANGGVLGQKIEIEIGDDASEPKQGTTVANKFVGDGVTWVVGHFNSGVTIPASDVYEKAGIIFVTPAATNPQVTERGYWNAFRVCGRDDQQGKVWADYIKANFAGKNVAILHDKTTYGQGLADAAKKFLDENGTKYVLYEGINPGEKDYSAVVTKLKSLNADVLVYGGLQTEAGLLVKQMRDQGMKTLMMSGDGITSQEFATIGGDGVIGTLMTFGPDPTKRESAAETIKSFGDFKPEGYTLYSYASVQILAQAAEAAKSVEPEEMAKVMHSGHVFKTVLGDISFDAKGDRTSIDYVMYTWKKLDDGKIGYVQND